MKQKGNSSRYAKILAALLMALAPALALASPPPHATQQAKEQPRQQAKEQPRQQPAPVRGNPVATDLDALSVCAEEIYDLASSGKIERIPKRLEALKKQAGALSYIKEEGNSVLLPRLGQTLADLEQAVGAKNRLDVMRYSNRITLIAATVEVPFKPIVPAELALLDYNGRELGIWSESKRIDRLSNIVMRMHLAWQTLMPKLIERNGTRELKKFSDTMGRLEAAKTSEEYCRLSKQVAAETASMKAIFARGAR